MNNRNAIHTALHTVIRSQQTARSGRCLTPGDIDSFPEKADPSMIRHVAFCRDCRQSLLHARLPARAREPEHVPDWTRMLTRLRRAARWILIKERIFALAANPFNLFPECVYSPVRLAEPVSDRMSLTIFEVNLTSEPSLSTEGLRITRMEQQPSCNRFLLEIAGFHPGMKGAEARLGLARRDSILAACGYRVGTLDWDLPHIEKQLEKAFTRRTAPAGRLKRLIRDTAWFDGVIESTGPGCTLGFECPDTLSQLFFRSDVWSILLVSKP